MKDSFEIISPVDGSKYATINYTSDRGAADIITVARQAQITWSARPLRDRQMICRRFIDELLAMSDDIALELTWQMGRPIAFAAKELGGVAERTEYMISCAESGLASLDVSGTGTERRIDRVPFGVCLVVAPWNFPYLTAVNTIIPALLAGNSVVLKSAGQTALCGDRFATALTKAGLPDGVFTSALLTHESVAKWIDNRLVDFVAFTGSVRGGTAIETAAAGKFLPVTLELGGKDPAYVRADADLPSTVSNLVDGAFFNSGQSCCSIERIYVDENIFDQFVADFSAEVTSTQILGDPTDPKTTLGPVVSDQAAQGIRTQIDAALSAGAERTTGTEAAGARGCYIPATTLVSVNHDMALLREETFGPAVGIMPVKGDEDAIRYMNDSPFGLSASIWSTDSAQASELGKSVRTGTLFVNRCDYLDPALAWVGVGESGRGCSLSELGFHHVTRPKSFYIG